MKTKKLNRFDILLTLTCGLALTSCVDLDP